MDGIERVEELFLCPLFVGDELDVVDQEQVDPPISTPEVVDLALLDAGDEFVGELLAGGIDDTLAREAGDDRVADGMHEMRLAEAYAAVQEKRVVGVAGPFRDGEAGRVGQAVRRTDDEVGEGVTSIDVGGRAFGSPDPGRLEADGMRRRCGARACRRATRPVRLGGRPDLEFDLDAIADDPGKRLGDQRAVAGLEPILGKAVGHGDPEPIVVDVDEHGVTEPCLEICRRQGDLKFSKCRAPNLFCVHRAGLIL